MSCEQCEDWQEANTGAFYFRVGNGMIGFGNIGVRCCEEHADLMRAIILGQAKRLDDGQWIKIEAKK